MTLTEMLTQAYDDVSDNSTKAKRILTAGMNRGLTRLRARLRRQYTIETVTFSYVAGQAQYQAPEDIIRGGEVYVTKDSVRTPLRVIDDINEWDNLKSSTNTSDRPEFVRWVQPDIYEVYPTPSANITNGGELRYQSRAKLLSQDDYTTGTISLTNGSAAVTGVGTVFTADMVGRFLRLADGNAHTSFYRVASYTSATSITLENYWGGETVSGKNYKIGEQPNLPNEYHQSLIDAGVQRYLLHRKDAKLAKEYGQNFEIDELQAKSEYEGLEHSSVIESKRAPNAARSQDPLSTVKEI